jgi:hypothetical protein
MINLNIVFGKPEEVARIQNTLKRLPWYRENGYTNLNLNLPQGVEENSSFEDIQKAVDLEYSDSKYNEYKEFIEAEWPTDERHLEEMKQIPSFQFRNTYEILLTQYGTGGSYESGTGKVIVNIKTRRKDQLMGTLLHEIVHISIEPLIKAHDVSQWRKERLVDLIGNKSFPDLRKMQTISEDVSVVDTAFEKYFPDIEEITKEIGSPK